MADNIKNKFGIQRKRNYLNRDFSDFRGELLRYANTYFKDKIQDFSEASLGGLFLDMAAYVGDNMSFYLDHQFNELNPNTVVESQNIETMVRNAGIKIMGNSPASVTVDFYIEINTELDPNGVTIPKAVELPTIKDGAKLETNTGIIFNLTESIDFSQKNENGTYIAETTAITDSTGAIKSFVFKRSGLCVSGATTTQTSNISSTFIPFRTVTLENQHVTSILRVYDSDGNDYHEVESLAQDTVFKKNRLSNGDTSLEVIASPYRFTTSVDIASRSTTLRFGSGDGSNILETKVPDPSDMALPLYGKETFSSYSLDPNRLLQSPSLGVSPTDTTLTIIYRYGGGADHNVDVEAIVGVNEVEFIFLPGTSYDAAQTIKNSLAVSNSSAAAGGAAAPTLSDLKNFVTSARTMQNRVVTTEDLLARIYTLPTEFGIVYRANVLPNPENALSSILYITSRDASGKLVAASDALKKNLSSYLNEFRLIGDAMDVLDASVINYQINITCRFSHNSNKYELISLIIRKVKALYTADTMALGKPIVKSDIVNVVINQPGVIACVDIKLNNVAGTIQNRTYSTVQKNLDLALKDDIYFAEPYEIYELRHPSSDIIVTVL
tara:strand:+ start:8472 stop:10301 length:1830 start_codon:yes stop_codon:yes gene_type:complete